MARGEEMRQGSKAYFENAKITLGRI
jgi:hypothetical protein